MKSDDDGDAGGPIGGLLSEMEFSCLKETNIPW